MRKHPGQGSPGLDDAALAQTDTQPTQPPSQPNSRPRHMARLSLVGFWASGSCSPQHARALHAIDDVRHIQRDCRRQQPS
eukprot:902070-Rhodomonas_salina.3